MTSGYEQQPFDIRRPSLEIQVGPWIVLWGGKMLGKNLVTAISISFAVHAVSLPTFAKELISITAVGDIMMGTTYPSSSMLPENNGKNLFEPAKEWIEASDIRFGNFEGTFFDGPAQPDGKAPGPNRFLFKTPTQMGPRLSEAGFNVVSLSNNHSRDFGGAGMKSTKEVLQQNGIQYSSKTGEIATFSIDGQEVVLLATDFYKGQRSIVEPASTYLEISKHKQAGKLVIVSAHAGGEGAGAEIVKLGKEIFLGENRGDSVQFARDAIDKGADLIIMHGPHVPRALEVYRKRLVAYSLGNFMTGKGISLDGYAKVAPLLRVQINKQGEFVKGQIVSFVQRREPQRIDLDKEATALKMMAKLSNDQFKSSPLQFETNGILSVKSSATDN